MSLPEMLQAENLFAYDPHKSREAVNHNQSEMECARAIVEQEISLCTNGSKLPAELASLLNDAWTEVLAAIYVEDGFGSIRWLLAMEITDELLWTLQPKKNMAERTKMISMLPTLVKLLRQGLASVSWDKKQSDSLMSSLSRYHMSVLSREQATRQARLKNKEHDAASVGNDASVEASQFNNLDNQKGWVFRPDTNEWIYQDEPAHQIGLEAERLTDNDSGKMVGQARKVGRGDH